MNVEVFAIGAYWRNDLPGGLGTLLPFEKGGWEFCQRLEGRTLRAPPEITAETTLVYLRQKAAARERTEDDALSIIQAVYWLQKNRHIETDEYNGTIFYCKVEGRDIVISERNPVLVDMVSALANPGRPGTVDISDIVHSGPLDQGRLDAIRVVTDHARAQRKSRP